MSDATKRSKRITITAECLDLLARDAFFGSNEPLAEKIKAALSYEEGGRRHPANDFTLADTIKTIRELEAGDVLDCVERLTVRLMHENASGSATELLHGDRTSIAMIYYNLTGQNFEGKPEEHKTYLAWAKKYLPFPALDPEKVFILVK